ncbi:MAG: NnrU family protein [Alphaproteobacteria bacterium]|nr:NnrU family protein [Rhodospirillaceae bacterium]MBT6513105.1 NnrU family protein [Rhodospirillaceae bacterium]MBT7645909.1 NnrU family protein [Rhodospirillaceae bacterium]MDG2481495.1 NnrU family protein [Alphaproteobacteria bacterium]
MTTLILACIAFVASHIVLSGTALRGMIAGRISEPGFLAVFSLVALASITWMVIAFNSAGYVEVWNAGRALKGIAWIVMLPAVLFVVCGNVTPNPSSVGSEKLLQKDDIARGIFTVTRHPLMWGIALWAIAHVMANGDLAGLIFFGTMLVLTLAGVASQEQKKRARAGDAWDRFAAKTSFLPFLAIIERRTSLDLKGIGWWRATVSAVVYAALVLLHPWVIGVSPIPQ